MWKPIGEFLESYSKISWKMKGKFTARRWRNFPESARGNSLKAKRKRFWELVKSNEGTSLKARGGIA